MFKAVLYCKWIELFRLFARNCIGDIHGMDVFSSRIIYLLTIDICLDTCLVVEFFVTVYIRVYKSISYIRWGQYCGKLPNLNIRQGRI